MKLLYILIACLIFCGGMKGQNLVPNPSFEEYDTCPNNGGQLQYATFWNNPLIGSSPDYLNSCGISNWSVPSNIYGFQSAHSGVGYAAIVTANLNPNTQNDWNAREYLQVELLSPLQAGFEYCIGFYVSPCDSVYYVSNNIGVYFSQNEIHDTCQFCNLPYTPQFENPNNNDLSNNNIWTLVSGNYTAIGGERYIVIGNFMDSAHTQTTFVGYTSLAFAYYALYYIDDVSVTLCDSTTGIGKLNNPLIKIYPNPATTTITISQLGIRNYELGITDILGREVYHQPINNSTQATIDISALPNGIYILALDGRSFYKVIKLN